jgi:hypothetical protein
MDSDELNQELAWAIGESFLRSLHYLDKETKEWRYPKDVCDALVNRKAIMQNWEWDTDAIEKINRELLRENELWEDNGEYMSCSFDFGEYPTVPKWVEIFGLKVSDCSPQTHYYPDDEYILKEIFVGLFSEDPADRGEVLKIFELTPPAMGNP